MGWKQRVLGLASLLALAACGPSPARTSLDTPTGPERPSTGPDSETPPPPSTPDSGTETPDEGTPPPDDETPLEDPDEGTPPPSEGVDGPTLEPAACVPWTGRTLPREEPPCEVNTQLLSGSEQRRYDAEGHLLEHRTWRSDGTLTYAESQTWVDGLQVRQRIEETPGTPWSEKEWTYDAERRVVQRTDRMGMDWWVQHQFRYAEGRLDQIDHRVRGEWVSATLYQYDAAGRLTRTDNADECDLDLGRCESFAYDAAGQLRSVSRRAYPELSSGEEYDALGRLVATSWREFKDSRRTTRAYDLTGRLIRIDDGQYGYRNSTQTATVFSYDAEERPVLQWMFTEKNAYIEDDDTTKHTTSRSTTRLTYLCGTSLLHQKEWDGNEDGVPDARCTYERDASGRLLREQCTGEMAVVSGFLRRDSRYDCH